MFENVILIRNIFYRCFFISFGLLLFSTVMVLLFKDFIIGFHAGLFNTGEVEIGIILYTVLGNMKIMIFNLFLVPALALHWTGNKLEKGQK